MHLHPVLIGSSEDAYHHGRPISIVPDARRRHLAVFGGSGSGKSTLFRNMLAGDIAAGHGVTVVDPHGQLVEEILENHIPRHRTNDVIYFNPKDRERAFALNMLECRRSDQRGLVISNVIGIFKKLWAESWGPRMEDILRNGLYALIEQPSPVFDSCTPRELFSDQAYRAHHREPHAESGSPRVFFITRSGPVAERISGGSHITGAQQGPGIHD